MNKLRFSGSGKLRNGLMFIAKQVLIVLAAFAIASVIITLSGFPVSTVGAGILNAITGDIGGTLRWFTPLIFTGLACAVAFKAGIWNMGVDGQLYMGAIVSTAVALKLTFLPAPLQLALCVLCGMAAGAACAIVVALLRVYCGAPEVVTSMLMNYIIFYFTDYMVMGPLKGSGDYATAQSSDMIAEALWLPRVVSSAPVNIGLFVGMVLAVAVGVLMSKTTFGYKAAMLGTNRAFANYGGINIKASYIKILAVSGAIAGLAGIVEIFGIHHRFPFRFSNNLGYDGMVVSILANDNPLGCLLSAFFFAVLRNGSYNIERLSDLPRTLVLVVQAIIIILVGAKYVLKRRKNRLAPKEETAKEPAEEVAANG